MPKNRPASDYAVLGIKVANAYLQSKVPLTQTLKKIAQDEDLNTHQIERVAEAANQETFQQLFPKREGGDVPFEPASAEEVISDLNAPTKIAADLNDYDFRPDALEGPSLDEVVRREFGGTIEKMLPELEKSAGHSERRYTGDFETLEDFEKTATSQERSFFLSDHNPVVDRRTIIELTKAAEHFNVERMKIAEMAKEEIAKFAGIVHRMVKAGQKVEDLYKAAMMARPDQKESLTHIFGQVIADLEKKGTFGGYKKVAQDVNPGLISSRLSKLIPPHGCTVLNGKHPLTLSINVLADLSTQWEEANKGHAIARDAVEKAKRVTDHIGPEAQTTFR